MVDCWKRTRIEKAEVKQVPEAVAVMVRVIVCG